MPNILEKEVGGIPYWAIGGIALVGVIALVKHKSATAAAATPTTTAPTNTTAPPVFFLPEGSFGSSAPANITVNLPRAPGAGPPRGIPTGPIIGTAPITVANPTPPPVAKPTPVAAPKPAPKPAFTSVTVVKYTTKNPPWNSTLSGIAAHYHVAGGYQALAKLNGISNPNLIHVGQIIKVPT